MSSRYLLICIAFFLFSCDTQKKVIESSEIIVTDDSEKIVSPLMEAIQKYHDFQDNNRVDPSEWEDLSEKKVSEKKSQLVLILDQLNKISASDLSEKDLINYEMLKIITADKLYNLEYETHLMPLNSEGGFIIGMVYQTQNSRLKSQENIDNYFQKLRNLPNYVDQKISFLERGLKENKKLPKVVIQNCINMLDQYLETPPEELFISKPFKDLTAVSEKGYALVEAKVIPAFEKLKSYLRDQYLPNTKDAIGISVNKGGKEYYEQRVRFYTTLEMTPEEVYATGLSEVKRIRGEMEAIITSLGFDGTYADFLEFLRTDQRFYPKTAEELLSHASWLSKKAEEILPKYFTKLPRLPFTVNPVPASIAPNYTTGRYSGGSMERQQAGQYWVNTYNLPSRPLFVLPALTLHEAVPGHHLQISLANELEDLPRFRNTYLSAFGEGWGLYSEYLGKEAGMYTTPYEDFGRLTYEMWRACRLVVDPGMHYMGMTRDEAVEYMASNTALSLHEVNTEINRYIGWPGQAVSYKIGELKIRELRNRAEAALGDKFDIRTFHDKVLSNGSIPLSTLERIVENYIDASL